MKSLIGPDLKVLIGPLLVIIFTAMFAILGINFSYSTITKRLSDYKVAKNLENTLESKLDILRTVEAGSLENSNLLVQVLPSENPGSLIINSNKNKSQEYLIEIGNIDLKGSAASSSEGMYYSNLGLQLTALSLNDMLAYLESQNNVAPINNLQKVEISVDEEGLVDAKVELNIYWADYPKTIAAVSAPVSDLTQTENESLNNFSKYELPDVSEFSPNLPSERESPFN